MRLENYLITENVQSILSNVVSNVAKLDAKTMEYQTKIHWYSFVDFVREKGSEEKLIDFINKTFNKNIISLDDVNLKMMKPWEVNESNILSVISAFIKIACNGINDTIDNVKKCVRGIIILYRIFAPQKIGDII